MVFPHSCHFISYELLSGVPRLEAWFFFRENPPVYKVSESQMRETTIVLCPRNHHKPLKMKALDRRRYGTRRVLCFICISCSEKVVSFLFLVSSLSQITHQSPEKLLKYSCVINIFPIFISSFHSYLYNVFFCSLKKLNKSSTYLFLLLHAFIFHDFKPD